MDSKRKERMNFLIDLAFWAVILALVYVTLKYLINLVMPFFLAFIFAALARPAARFLSAETKKVKNKDGSVTKVPRRVSLNYNFAAILSVLLVFLMIIGLVSLIVFPVIGYISDKVVEIPTLYTNVLQPALEDLLSRLDKLPMDLEEPIAGIIQNAIPNLLGSIGSLATNISVKAVGWVSSLATSLPNMLLKGLICLIATVFISVDYDRIIKFFRLNLHNRLVNVLVEVKNSMVEIVGQFIRSYFLIFLITATEIVIGLLIIGVDRPLMYAVLIAIFDAFPVVGSGMILLPWTVITMVTGNVLKGVGLLILYLIVVIARQIIEPKIVGKHVGLRPIVTLTCMYVGTKLFGGIGLFGLPIAAAIIADLNTDGKFRIYSSTAADEDWDVDTEPNLPPEENV